MEECSVCDISARYICTTCNIHLCEDHQVVHKSKKKDHNFHQLGIELNSEEIAKIVENLSLKIKIAGECQVRIMQETITLIKKIQSICMNAINTVREKEEKYIRLLKISQQILLSEQMREIKSELEKTIEIKVPTPDFNETEDFYKLSFLHEQTMIKLEEVRDALADGRNFIFQGHKDYVRALAITSDNKYIISGSNDKSVRIWNIEVKKEEAFHKDHTGYVSSITSKMEP